MSRDETKKILMRIQTTFPNWKPQGDLSLVVDVWHEYLEDYEYEEILIALKAYTTTDTSGFAPSIGQLIGKLQTISNANKELNEMEAWSLVSQALKNGYYGAEEEFAKLPEVVQKAVGTPANLRAWAHTDESSIENVVQSNFMRTYRTVVKRESECAKLPLSIKNLIERVTNENLLDCNK
jgi:hypothetical protein